MNMSNTSTISATPDYELPNFKAGSITRVKLVNFLTYSEVEFKPGPKLNIVVGPNGTGKSTLLCAICLGLGGQPPLLGRADDVRLFIMHQRDTAVIELELEGNSSFTSNNDEFDLKSSHVIKRVLDRREGSTSARSRGLGASKYFIDNKPTTLTKVKQLVAAFGIQIENLCTFLPQDKVGNFSGFSPQQLLVETQKACLPRRYETHQRLIELEQQLAKSTVNLSTVQNQLELLNQEQQSLEQQKHLLEQRQEALQLKTKLEQKRAWVEFDEGRHKALELKQLKKHCKDAVKNARLEVEPLQKAHDEALERVHHSKVQTHTVEQKISAARAEESRHLRQYEQLEEEMETTLSTLTSLDAQQRNLQRRAEQQQLVVDKMKQEISKYPDRQTLVDQKDSLQKISLQYQKETNSIRKEQGLMLSRQVELTNLRNDLNSKLTKLDDDKARRREAIFARDPNLAASYEWIDKNRKQFRRPIHGPIACEVEVASGASFLEQHVPNAVWKQFVVECKEDYNLLYREVRTKLGLSINIILITEAAANNTSTERMYSDKLMQELRQDHGIQGYLDECFTAPPPILQALKAQAKVHQVLVGNRRTQDSLDQGLLQPLLERDPIKNKLRSFAVFSATDSQQLKTTSTVSRYSQTSSLRMDEVGPAKMLAPAVPQQRKDRIRHELEELESQLHDLNPQIEDLQQRYETTLNQLQDFNQEFHTARNVLNEYETLRMRLSAAEKKLVDLNAQASQDQQQERQQLIDRLKTVVGQSVIALQKAGQANDTSIDLIVESAALKLAEEGLDANARLCKQTLAQMQNQFSVLEQEFDRVSKEFDTCKQNLKNLKERAESIAPMLNSAGETLPLKAVLEVLPATLPELDAAIDDAQIKIDTIADNPEILHHYEKRKAELEQTVANVTELATSKQALQMEMDREFGPWEAALSRTCQAVDALFGIYMQELGNVGQVCLSKSQSLAEWGIEIQVKFRKDATLQCLNAHVQSGGERSVSTIMYLMALLESSNSHTPFRCVDEINQGLDERNERLVFRRIVANSTTPQSGQYFLITPKLLPNLTDMEHPHVTVLCIFNGPYNFKHFNDWQPHLFVERSKKRLRQQ